MTKPLFAVILAAIMVHAVSLDAQNPQPQKLETAKSLSCAFTLMATGTWNKGEPHAEIGPARLKLRFVNVDTQESTAEVVDPVGPAYAVVRLGEGSLHFITTGKVGALYMTTVFDRETSGGKLMAVHSRHEYTEVSLPGYTSRPEQYYGECELSR